MKEPPLYAILLAGGEGTRFAPLSTPEKPKQFLSFFGESSFLQNTHRRLQGLVSDERIYVMTSSRYRALVQQQLPEIPADNIIGEKYKRNTAPSIAYVSKLIAEKDPNAIAAVFPSDAMIETREQFQNAVRLAVTVAHLHRRIVVVGIEPQFISSEYGYVRCGAPLQAYGNAVSEVRSFTEKPDPMTAGKYVTSGCYLWNGGMFIFPVALLLQEIERYMPSLGQLLTSFQETPQYCDWYFEHAEPLSIDYGVMEKSSDIAMVRANFAWSDIGTWQGLKEFVERTKLPLREAIMALMTEQLIKQEIAQ